MVSNYRAKVLIVDDYDINLELLEAYLYQSQNNLEIFTAKNGLNAMHAFHDHEFDLVLMDVMLPDINGFDLCYMMKEIRGENLLPIIMITALDDRESMLKGLATGADDFLTKPVNSDELTIRINNLLRQRKLSLDLRKKYEELSKDLLMARSLLIDFLPRNLPQTDDIYTEVVFKPSSFIGGDFYDIFEIDNSKYGYFISDVKGHGSSAAMIVALIKEQIYELNSFWSTPKIFIEKLNERLCRFFKNIRNDYFVSAIFMVYDKIEHTIEWVNAGHTPPVYFSRGNYEVLNQPSGLPLGIIEPVQYGSGYKLIRKFSELLLYTDGIFELQLFYQCKRYFDNIDALLTLLTHSDIRPTASIIISEVRSSLRRQENADDVSVIGLKF